MSRKSASYEWNTVAIVGVGLIGGSVGAALRQNRLAARVVGVGRRASSLRQARHAGCIDAATTSIARGVADADLVVVCTPVRQIAEHVVEAAEHCPASALITDAGSTKAEIVAAVAKQSAGRINFVGSHPLAGSEKTGAQHARGDLFQGRLVLITPSRKTSQEAVRKITRFWRSLGGEIRQMTPRAHDQAVAAVSHLPHLIASAVSAATPARYLPLAAAGWQDTTRIAAADVGLWREIFHDNRDHLLKSLDRFENVLAKLRRAVECDDQSTITKLLQAGKENRDTVGS